MDEHGRARGLWHKGIGTNNTGIPKHIRLSSEHLWKMFLLNSCVVFVDECQRTKTMKLYQHELNSCNNENILFYYTVPRIIYNLSVGYQTNIYIKT